MPPCSIIRNCTLVDVWWTDLSDFSNGSFKPTVSSLVGQLYKPGDKRLDAGYTIFYMGVNVGSFIAPLVCGYFGDTGNRKILNGDFCMLRVIVFTILLFETQKNKYLFSLVSR